MEGGREGGREALPLDHLKFLLACLLTRSLFSLCTIKLACLADAR